MASWPTSYDPRQHGETVRLVGCRLVCSARARSKLGLIGFRHGKEGEWDVGK